MQTPLIMAPTFLLLVANVLPHDGFIYTYRGDEVSSRTEMLPDKIFSHVATSMTFYCTAPNEVK